MEPDLSANRLQLLGRIAGGVAHDVASYLSAIDASMVLAGRASGDRLVLAELQRARAALDRAARLTRTLVQHARQGAILREPMDLTTVVKQTLEVLGRLIPPEIEVPIDFDATVPLIAGVRTEIEQLILNLVVNACEAMPEGGTLSISVRTLGSHVAMIATDTGTGLPPAVLDCDFPTTPSTKRGRGGSGLGLGIVRAIAERHEAKVRIVPRAAGTHLEILFPRLGR